MSRDTLPDKMWRWFVENPDVHVTATELAKRIGYKIQPRVYETLEWLYLNEFIEYTTDVHWNGVPMKRFYMTKSIAKQNRMDI